MLVFSDTAFDVQEAGNDRDRRTQDDDEFDAGDQRSGRRCKGLARETILRVSKSSQQITRANAKCQARDVVLCEVIIRTHNFVEWLHSNRAI